MAISLASLRTTSVLTPPRILIHGVAGVGKSTFAADADRPVFVMTEDGLGKLQVPHFPLGDELCRSGGSARCAPERGSRLSARSSLTASTGWSR